ncbi:MAG TPA: hypothetical protein VER04_28995 [Polyangiaceae bacterium]|nr:hypothetical protein [Polyangiaceae bacterium]
MKAAFKSRGRGGQRWHSTFEDFQQVPRVGDYIARTTSSTWVLVELVAWLPDGAEGRDCDVEIYGVEVDQAEILGNLP